MAPPRFTVRLLVAGAFLLLASRALAAPALWAGVEPGPFAVGVHSISSGESRALVWYPASAGGAPLVFRDLLPARGGELLELLTENGVSKADAEAYLASRLFARRDAPVLDRVSRLVLIAPGNDEGPADQAVLAEVLASHGFLVATPEAPVATPMKDENDIGAAAEKRALQLEAVRATVASSGLHRTSGGVALVGHSFGARAALLFAMRNPDASGLVSLDGGIGSSTGVDSFRRAPSFDAKKAILPILHLYEELDAFMKPDLGVLKQLSSGRLQTERIGDLHHVHFTTLGFAAATLPGIRRVTGAGAGVCKGVVRVAQLALGFLAPANVAAEIH